MIRKETVIGFVIIKCNYLPPDETFFLSVIPIAVDSQGGMSDEENDIEKDDEVLGVIPAPPETFKIYGVLPDGLWKELGYEFKGSFVPDWEEKLSEIIEKKFLERG